MRPKGARGIHARWIRVRHRPIPHFSLKTQGLKRVWGFDFRCPIGRVDRDSRGSDDRVADGRDPLDVFGEDVARLSRP